MPQTEVITISDAELALLKVLRNTAMVKGSGEIPVTITAGNGAITGHDVSEAVEENEMSAELVDEGL